MSIPKKLKAQLESREILKCANVLFGDHRCADSFNEEASKEYSAILNNADLSLLEFILADKIVIKRSYIIYTVVSYISENYPDSSVYLEDVGFINYTNEVLAEHVEYIKIMDLELLKLNPYIDIAIKALNKQNTNASFAECLIEEIKNKDFKKELQNLKRSIRKNTSSVNEYIESLFDKHSKLLLVRVDLAYQSHSESKESLSTIQSDRKQLIKEVKTKYRENFLGYVWKLEYGVLTGLHYHFLFIFNGDKLTKDISKGCDIGNMWCRNNDGRRYFNCNMLRYKYPAIGTIKYDDPKRNNIHRLVEYLTKEDLFIKFKHSDADFRTFGKGQIKKPKCPINKEKRGRPRGS